MEREFIIAIRKHRKLGEIPGAYFIWKDRNRIFYTVDEAITLSKITEKPHFYTAEQKQLVKLIDEFNDTNLFKLFAKKKKVAPIKFIDNLTEENLVEQIWPFIEKRIYQIAKILESSNIRLYHKNNVPSNLYPEDEIKVNSTSAKAIFNFSREDDGIKYFLSIKQDDRHFTVTDKPCNVLSNSPCVMILENELLVFDDIGGKKITPFLDKFCITIPKKNEDSYFKSFILNNIKSHQVTAKGFSIINMEPDKKMVLNLVEDIKGLLVLSTDFIYNDKAIFAGDTNRNNLVDLVLKDNDYCFNKYKRDHKWEDNKLETILNLGLISKTRGVFNLKGSGKDIIAKNYKFTNWLRENRAEFERNGISINQEASKEKISLDKISLEISFSDDNKEKDWFGIYAMVQIGKFKIPFIEFKDHILNDNREFRLPNGEIAILPEEWFKEHKDLFLYGKDDGKTGLIELKNHHAHVVNVDKKKADKKYLKFIQQLDDVHDKKVELPENIDVKLRPYQYDGYSWMYSLQKYSLGGCLADDMGLGKTVQSLALITKTLEDDKTTVVENDDQPQQLSVFEKPAVKKKIKTSLPASLIVMPTSLVHNWYNEIKKFTPHIKVLKHNGQRRVKNIDKFDKYNIILTTYGTIRNDIELIGNYCFNYIILDESQYIKNPGSKIYKSVTRLTSNYKLILTGTPIENSLTDLWAQINFINDGLLGNLNFFKEEFVFPIQRHGDIQKQEKLKALINPFILRRTKEEVLKDLPNLTEQTIHCEMSSKHEEFYKEEKSKIRKAILETIEDTETKGSKTIYILKGLMKLRQVANHPVLIDNEYGFDSGKFKEITNKLETLMAGNHKVLIFSSFVKHLDVFADYFKDKNWEYSLLTGKQSGKDREKVIDNFQNNSNNKLFLISIKAGGAGLNLTSADYVFIIDPWWNPAVEMQAISRAHRMGQNKKVFVYRFISKDTIEEKIHILQNKKSKLAETFINSNNPFDKVNKEMLEELFN